MENVKVGFACDEPSGKRVVVGVGEVVVRREVLGRLLKDRRHLLWRGKVNEVEGVDVMSCR